MPDNQTTATYVDLPFDELMRTRTQQKKKYYDEKHWNLVTEYVTMAKRFNGDYLGVMRTDRRNIWNGIINNGFFTYPVVMRSLRSKTATSLATDIKLDIKSVLQIPEKVAGAEMAANIYQHVETSDWTDRLETAVAMLGQLGRFAVIQTETYEDAGLTVGYKSIEEERPYKTQLTTIACMDCGAKYGPEDFDTSDEYDRMKHEDDPPVVYDDAKDSSIDPDDEVENSVPPNKNASAEINEQPGEKNKFEFSRQPNENGAMEAETDQNRRENSDSEFSGQNPQIPTDAKCLNPNCGSPNLGIMSEEKEEMGMFDTGEQEAIRAAKVETTVLSPMLFRYDDLHTIGFDWQKAHWVNFHPPESLYEIVDGFPEIKDKIQSKALSDWSDSTRWYYELTKGNGNLGWPATEEQSIFDEITEVDYWYFEPIMCNGWRHPIEDAKYELVKNGVVVFDIMPGETPKEAFKRREPGKEFSGLMVKFLGDEILDVKNCSFKDYFTFVGWNISVTTHVPNGEERLINLQDAATRVFSNLYLLVQRSSNAKGIVDGRYFNVKDFLGNVPGKWITTKQDINADESNQNILNRAGYLAPPQVSNLVETFVQLLIEIIKEETGIYDETVGNANPQNVTKGGRELAVDQSLSLQTPMAKTKKQGKIDWIRLRLKLWQTMPDEAFILIKGTYNEEWKPEDIAAFKNLDIDSELLISSVAGSDIPKSRSSMVQSINMAVELGLFSPQNFLPPELTQKIVKEYLGIDYDFDNVEADRRLAAKRLDVMNAIAAQAAATAGGWDRLIVIQEDPMTGAPTRILHPDLTMMIAQDLRTKVWQEDAHPVYINYYVDIIKGLCGRSQPREVDILIAQNAIDMHNQMVADIQAKQMMAQKMANDAANPPPPALPAGPPEKDPLETPTGPNAPAEPQATGGVM